MGKSKYVICGLLILFFIFTSGLVFELTKSKAIDHVDMPYTVALSAERTGILGIFNDNDAFCAYWLGNQSDKSIVIYGGYNAISLVMDYSKDFPRFKNTDEPRETHYVFLTTWNVEHNVLVLGSTPALRVYRPLPDLSHAQLVCWSGKAKVYLKIKHGGE